MVPNPGTTRSASSLWPARPGSQAKQTSRCSRLGCRNGNPWDLLHSVAQTVRAGRPRRELTWRWGSGAWDPGSCSLLGHLGGWVDPRPTCLTWAQSPAPGKKSPRCRERNPFTFIGDTGGRRTIHQRLDSRELANSDQNSNQEHNCTALGHGVSAGSVPLPVPLGVVLASRLHVVEVEVGHHVSHGQHQPVQALVVVQTSGPSVLRPLPLQQRDSSELGLSWVLRPSAPTPAHPGPCWGEEASNPNTRPGPSTRSRSHAWGGAEVAATVFQAGSSWPPERAAGAHLNPRGRERPKRAHIPPWCNWAAETGRRGRLCFHG